MHTEPDHGRVAIFCRLNSSDVDGEPMYIQMVTALVLQLIQCVVHLPCDKDNGMEDEFDKKVRAYPPDPPLASVVITFSGVT